MDIKFNHFKQHLFKYKDKIISAKQLYYLMETFYNIDYNEFDIFLLIDELDLQVEECDNKRGYYYYNEIARYHRSKYKLAKYNPLNGNQINSEYFKIF